jgi:hypothetical protein
VSYKKIATVLIVIVTAGGCGDEESNSKEDLQSTAEAVCRAAADCRGDDDASIEQCREGSSSQVDAADRDGCINIMNDWYSCLLENSTCNDEGKYDDEGACGDQEELAEDCRKGRL